MDKCKVKIADMEEDMLDYSKKVSAPHQQIICEAFDQHKEEKDIANHIWDEFDKTHGPSWNTIVGKNFGAHVVHRTLSYLFLQYGE